MDSHISCLRCAKRIAVKPEMIGQTILCPNCLDRVYVSESSNQGKPVPATSNSSELSNVPRGGVDAAALLKKNQAPPPQRSNSLLVAAAAVVLLVIVGGVIAYTLRPAKTPPTIAARSANLPPVPEMDDEPDREPPEKDADDDDGDAPRRPVAVTAAKLPAGPGGTSVNPASATAADAKLGSGEPANSNQAMPPPEPIMAGWAELWRLPPASASGAAEVLTPLRDAASNLRVSMRSADGDLRFAPITIEPEGGPNSGAWTIKRLANPLSADGRTPLASLRRDGSNLLFAWAAPEHEQREGPSITNCLIELHDGKQRRVGQLREPVRSAPLTLDLENESQIIETKIDDLPRLDAVRLEILELAGFPGDAKVRGGNKAFAMCAASLAAKPAAPAVGLQRNPLMVGPQPLVVEFGEIPGLELRLRCASDAGGKLAIAVDPIYKDAQEHDLRVPKLLDRLEAEARKPMPNAERELGPEENKLRTWQAKAKDQKGKEPPQNSQRHAAWNLEHRKTLAKVAEFEANVNRYKKIVDACQARLDAVAKLREFMKQVEEKQATIHYIVYGECGDPDILLVDGRGKR